MTKHATKRCKDCGEVLSLRNFYKHPTYRDGYMNSCRSCKNKAVRENYELKAEVYRERKRRIDATPKYREMRSAYQRSERGREVHRAACRRYYRLKQVFA
jgi:hypothetical protein